jgi:hypothetical protein
MFRQAAFYIFHGERQGRETMGSILHLKFDPGNDSMSFANFLEVARTAMRATVITCAALITVMLSAVVALIDVAKC